MKLGYLLTKPPHGTEDSENILRMANSAAAAEEETALFLISDGVYTAKQGVEELEQLVTDLIELGGEVIACRASLKARGLTPEKLVDGVTIAEDTYDSLVDRVMEDWDRVVVM